jgi:hypothetical protein
MFDLDEEGHRQADLNGCWIRYAQRQNPQSAMTVPSLVPKQKAIMSPDVPQGRRRATPPSKLDHDTPYKQWVGSSRQSEGSHVAAYGNV